MPIGVGAALLIGSAVSGGAAIGAAKLQSNAASKAQKAQQAATDQALKVQQEASAPYRALGQQGAAGLAAQSFQPYTQQFRAPGGAPSNGYQPFQPSGGAPAGSLGAMGGGATQGPQGQPQPNLVTLQAPDGSTRPFPAQDVPRIIAQAHAAGHELRQV